ncbi:hypothetical protein ACG2F4_05785 [Halalkalibaculum sp. DA3122]|uniref:hypothetical protein n=1 Tax=Halalkalibaculum sp. DA3122 TaxID=3373607 RepID=UPI00375464F9
MHLEKRISALLEATQNWLNKDNEYLSTAYDQTVREGFFSFEDVKYALLAIREAVSETAVRDWVQRAGLSDTSSAEGQNVLCLHAGNIPLVGFQDAFAAILSGATYYGKISRKDPYLLPTFLNEVKKTGVFSDIDIQWVHNLKHLEGLQTDKILFAGSEDSVPGVKQRIEELHLASSKTRYLVRTAHFSIACLANPQDLRMEELVEAVFRYGGKGCRSVAIVVAPVGLDEVKSELTDHVRDFWSKNPQQESPGPRLKYRYAYNRAITRTQVWLNDFLLQEGGLEMDQDFICYWVQGDEQKAAELAAGAGDRLQSVYVTDSETRIPGFEERTELLSVAQAPPLDWKPDGTDTLEWLTER